jgi:histidinol phosphatase-like enzyme (inositol monophosphatase family)
MIPDQLSAPRGWHDHHQGRLAAMIDGGTQAARRTLDYFGGRDLGIESKADASPVTVADRTAEAGFRDFLEANFPQDSLLGEEHGTRQGTSPYRWIIDPIDGTKSFIAGVPMYSTLVAIEFNQEPIAGGIWIPALGEVVLAARDLGCWHRRDSTAEWEPARVSRKTRLEESIFLTTAVDSFGQVEAAMAFDRLQSASWFTRTWGDGYGYLLVATGRAEVMVDPIVSPWDIAAIRPVIEQAGGRFSDWSGAATTKSSNAVGTNGLLHDQVLKLLAADDPRAEFPVQS